MSATHPSLPVVAITVGDPAGIGPEVALATAGNPAIREICRPVLIGDRAAFHWTPQSAGLAFRPTPDPASPPEVEPGEVCLHEPGLLSAPAARGIDSREAGAASFGYVQCAIDWARRGALAAVATAPISKKAWSLAGIDAPGHTEVFAAAFAPGEWAMLLTSPRISVGLVTIHRPLATVPAAVTRTGVVAVARLMHETLGRMRGRPPRLAVLGLNPHAGEHGLLGPEDSAVIAPAVADCRAEGIDAEGPLPPDTAFSASALARYDGHVCMYHDQGLIPFKMIAFEDGVNMTMGLKGVVRTSPDHGTAYDIAGRGIANPSSMIEAVRLAARLAPVGVR